MGPVIQVLLLAGVFAVQGCPHNDRVYLQPIHEFKFKDDWKEQYPAKGSGNDQRADKSASPDETNQTPEVPPPSNATHPTKASMPNSVPPENTKSVEDGTKSQPLQSPGKMESTTGEKQQLMEMETSNKEVDTPKHINSTAVKIPTSPEDTPPLVKLVEASNPNKSVAKEADEKTAPPKKENDEMMQEYENLDVTTRRIGRELDAKIALTVVGGDKPVIRKKRAGRSGGKTTAMPIILPTTSEDIGYPDRSDGNGDPNPPDNEDPSPETDDDKLPGGNGGGEDGNGQLTSRKPPTKDNTAGKRMEGTALLIHISLAFGLFSAMH